MACIAHQAELRAEMEAGNFTKEEETAAKQKLVRFEKRLTESNILMVMAMARILKNRDRGDELASVSEIADLRE